MAEATARRMIIVKLSKWQTCQTCNTLRFVVLEPALVFFFLISPNQS